MSIVIENLTRCPICGEFLTSQKKYILIPPLISNERDELFLLSDTGVHLDCLDKYYLKKKLFKHIELLDDYRDRMKLAFTIHNPAEIIGFNLLTSNENEDLYEFNYFILLKKDIQEWRNLSNFRTIVDDFLNRGKWKGLNDFNYLEFLLNQLK